MPHFLKFKYKIEETGKDGEENGDQDQREGESNDEEYLIEKRIDFPLKKVCYTNIYLWIDIDQI